MAAAEQPLPEGTDHIINGASSFDDDSTSTGGTTSDDAGTADKDAGTASASGGRGALFDKFDEVKAQSYDRAREYAVLGKDRTTGALDDFVRMINDTASQVDSKVGSQYGDYARRAAAGIGNVTDSIRDKDVDALFADARALVAKSPAVAIGAAAALGFVVARLARSGLPDGGADKDAPKA